MATFKKEKTSLTPSMIGFLVGLGIWIIIFVFLGIMYFVAQTTIPFLEKSLAVPIKYFMRGFWDALGVKSINDITRSMEIGVFLAAALMWGLLGALIGYLIQKFTKINK